MDTDKLYTELLPAFPDFLSFFPSLIQALDGNVYDHLKDYLMAFSKTELETCQAVQNTFQFLLETSSRVSLNWMILCNWILAAWTNPHGLRFASKIMTKLKGYYFWLLLSGIKLKDTRRFSWGEFFLCHPDCLPLSPFASRDAQFSSPCTFGRGTCSWGLCTVWSAAKPWETAWNIS